MSIEFRLKFIRETIDKNVNENLLKWNARKVLLNESFDEVSVVIVGSYMRTGIYTTMYIVHVIYHVCFDLGSERPMSSMCG